MTMCYVCNQCNACGKMGDARALLSERPCPACGMPCADAAARLCPTCGAVLPPPPPQGTPGSRLEADRTANR